MTHRVTLIPGDGIGPEVVEAARRVVHATGVEVRWDVAGDRAPGVRADRRGLPDRALASIRDNGVALKGPIETPAGAGIRSANIALRQGARPLRERPPVPALPGRAVALRGRRPRGRAGEHRGRVHGRRVRGGDRRGEGADRLHRGDDRHPHPRGQRDLGQGDLARGERTDRAVRLRGDETPRPSEGHGRRTRRTS